MRSLLIAALLAIPGAGHAADLEAGKEFVFKRCKICHSIVNGDEVIMKGNNVGPNLWGIIGAQAGTVKGYNYSPTTVEAGKKGLVWDEANMADYLEDTKGFMAAFLNDDGARSRMSFYVRDPEMRANIAAWLAAEAR